MLGQQEAPLQIRYIKAVGDFYRVCLSIVVGDIELDCPLSRNVQPSCYPIDSSIVFVEMQVFEEMKDVGHAF